MSNFYSLKARAEMINANATTVAQDKMISHKKVWNQRLMDDPFTYITSNNMNNLFNRIFLFRDGTKL